MEEFGEKLDRPLFSQLQASQITRVPMTTLNNWVTTGAVVPATLGVTGPRKPRLFSVNMIFQIAVTAKLVDCFSMSPVTAAALMRKTTTGHQWAISVARSVEQGRRMVDFFLLVFWSPGCGDWDYVVEGGGAGGVVAIQLKELARRDAGFAGRPMMLIPASADYATVYRACRQILSPKPATPAVRKKKAQ